MVEQIISVAGAAASLLTAIAALATALKAKPTDLPRSRSNQSGKRRIKSYRLRSRTRCTNGCQRLPEPVVHRREEGMNRWQLLELPIAA